MPKYRVLATSYINNQLVAPGDVVEYSGRPGSNLELMRGQKPYKDKDVARDTARTPVPANDSEPKTSDHAEGFAEDPAGEDTDDII